MLIAAFASFSLMLSSCSGTGNAKGGETASEQADYPSGKDFTEIMDYFDPRADAFFAELQEVMNPIKEALLNDEEVSEEQAQKLEEFSNKNTKNFEVLGMILAYDDNTNALSQDETDRLNAFADKYGDGLENLGFLLGLGGMTSEDMEKLGVTTEE